jgi:redox-sensitive bicupin YhaK (pirin superfamily)
VSSIYKAERSDIDDLVTYRAFPTASLPMGQLEPFLFLNHHGPQVYPPSTQGLPFGPHPHRGFETVTFILAGDLVHRDSQGFQSTIGPGGIQWMTAGSGIVHSELSSEDFKERGGELEILQLWVNLPSRLKMTPPRYIGLQTEDVPSLSLDEDRARVHLVSGSWDGHPGPIQSQTGVQLFWMDLQKGARLEREIATAQGLLLYVVRGGVLVDGTKVAAREGFNPGAEDTRFRLEALEESVVLFGHAPRNREPIASYGPFVMNTEQEILQAIEDYRSGKFGEMDE